MNSLAPPADGPLRVRRVAAGDLTARDIADWSALEARSAEPNAYLSPHFVLPALRHLDAGVDATVFMVERDGTDAAGIVGAGVFTRTNGNRFLPLPHFMGYRSRHSYLSGVLLDRELGGAALTTLIAHLRRHERSCGGIELPLVRADGLLARAATATPGPHGVLLRGVEQEERAILVMADAGQELLDRVLGHQRKDVARRMRRLSERGEVGWRWFREGGIPATAVEAFLTLEHAGWKGETGTSLRSRPSDEAFFREVVAGFGAAGRALFTELTVDGIPIASTSNFVSGRAGFAFKIGWDPAYKAYSPGMLNEVEFVRRAGAAFPDLDFFDSGATEGSFIERLWPSRSRLGHLVVPTTAAAGATVAAASWLRAMKRRLERRPNPGAPVHEGDARDPGPAGGKAP